MEHIGWLGRGYMHGPGGSLIPVFISYCLVCCPRYTLVTTLGPWKIYKEQLGNFKETCYNCRRVLLDSPNAVDYLTSEEGWIAAPEEVRCT